MSIKVMSDVWYAAELSPTEKFVLLAMADHADDNGRKCFPSAQRIALKCGLSVRQVYRVIKNLRQNGFLVVISKSARQPVHYRIIANARGRLAATTTTFKSDGDADILSGITPDTETHDSTTMTLMSAQPSLKREKDFTGSRKAEPVNSDAKRSNDVPPQKTDECDGHSVTKMAQQKDERFGPTASYIRERYELVNGLPCPWGPAEGKQLKNMLRRLHAWLETDINTAIDRIFQRHTNPAVSPRAWLPHLEAYSGPAKAERSSTLREKLQRAREEV